MTTRQEPKQGEWAKTLVCQDGVHFKCAGQWWLTNNKGGPCACACHKRPAQ
ncbi:hypothetical protein LCGC14_1822730 [marine sediment metagenome]|uniref:Uncharacterized protein n=1 Tax=marine sediment metagenome TaxID=412755 RepID=A0A0F9GIF1_9ZZZZ